jgi:ornithine carbamoyltransferase
MMERTGNGKASSNSLQGSTLAFVGDIQNNVTYDLMRAGVIMGMQVKVISSHAFFLLDAGKSSDEKVPACNLPSSAR